MPVATLPPILVECPECGIPALALVDCLCPMCVAEHTLGLHALYVPDDEHFIEQVILMFDVAGRSKGVHRALSAGPFFAHDFLDDPSLPYLIRP